MSITVSVFTESLKGLPTEQTFALLQALGISQVELGAAGHLDTSHLNPTSLLRPGAALGEYRALLSRFSLSVSALVCAINPLHPDKAVAAADHQALIDTCRLAAALETDTVVVTSGCPGDCASSKHPNFITTLESDENRQVLSWQWERVLLPYWKSAAAIAASYGIRRLAFDMQTGHMIHNPRTLLRLREEAGSAIGAAVDPAHLIAQGIDPAVAIRTLGHAVFHVRANDLLINVTHRAANGILHTDPDESPFYRRAIGNGHDAAYWQAIVHALRDTQYDRAVSLHYDDDSADIKEGLPHTVHVLKTVLQ